VIDLDDTAPVFDSDLGPFGILEFDGLTSVHAFTKQFKPSNFRFTGTFYG
jgi:hypothetical protein